MTDQARREKRLAGARRVVGNLEKLCAKLEEDIRDVESKVKGDPNTTVRRHIHLLHEYNDIKDVALGLMNMIAEDRRVRLIEVHKDYGVGADD